ncbi:MAG: DNA polymerase III subunit alpha, partial [Chrysiogenetes bacterium]|nr:DNA polymerase III subunit alpha [Chrysiogenetes bacterium]
MASKGDFVHCHLHTEYSFLDGANRISRLMERASEFGMPAISMTDHGNMCGTVEFYTTAKKHGIKPIIGCEAYVAPQGMTEKSGKNRNNHLILLAKNEIGYQNLCKLTSRGFMEGFYYNPRIDKEILAKHSEGLIGLSACLKGEVSYKLSQGDMDAARNAALEYKNIFDPGCFHLEIQENGLDIQKVVNERMLELAEGTGIPLAATADCHYLNADDGLAHKVLMYIGMNRNLEEGDEVETDLHFKDGELAAHQFSYAPEAVERTLWIADQCNLEFDMSTFHMPEFKPPEGVDLEKHFVKEAQTGLAARVAELRHMGRAPSPERLKVYEERLAYELKVIRQMGFPGYFLIVADFIQWAKKHGVPVGPGRGSAAGSLVAWCMRITEVDPIPYDLFFERFLNPGRKSMPDIDVDFCMDRRGEVIEYITEKYGGKERVAQIITYGKLKARAVIRDVGRVLGLGYVDVDKIAKLIPTRDPEAKNPLNVTLKRALEMEPRLKDLAKQDAKTEQLLEIAQRLEGLARHVGMHAAGVVIGNDAFAKGMPLYKTSDDDVVTQFDMGGVETLGFVKFDFLGLKTLTLIRHAEELVRAKHDPEFNIENISLEDPKTYDRLCEGDNIGVFQLESSGMRDTLLRLKPRGIEEISDILALYRPGPMDNIPEFADRKFGRKPVVYPLDALEPILGPTQGIIVYQEQIIRMASDLAGYTLAEADMFRRAVGKKKADEMEKQRAKFIGGAVERGHDKQRIEELWDLIVKFANYGFNKSHSVAYALITYQTA